MPSSGDVYGRDPCGQLHHYHDQETPELQQASNSKRHSNHQASLPTAGRGSIVVLNRLEALPELRPIPWRPGQELSRQDSLDSTRMQKRAATLLVTRGEIAGKPCDHCAAGRGRYSLCVSLDDWFLGACASCTFMSKGKDCSFRQHGLDLGNTHPEDATNVAKKRKRHTTGGMQPPAHTAFSISNPKLPQSVPVSPDLESMLQAEIAREENEQEDTQGDRGWEAAKPSYELPSKIAKKNNEAAAKQQQSSHLQRKSFNASTSRPGVQKVWTAGRILSEQLSGPPSSVVRQERSYNKQIPIIDTLQRSKQSQIYGVVSGLQSGIDHLQQQLDSLKMLLGIDTDNDND